MKRGWLLNLVLLAAVTALGWFAWLVPSRTDEANRPLSVPKPAEVRQVVLERPGQPAIRVERQDRQWRISAPLQARADEFQVMRMLTILEEKPAARLPATELQRFDLELPAVQLTIDGVAYAFGGINTVTREQYVMRGDAVYAVSLRHGAALPLSPLALVRRALLAENELPAAVLLPEFSVRQADGKWLLNPAADHAGPDELQQYIDRWRMATAARAEPHDGRPALADVRIELREGAPLVFSVLQRAPQLVLWRRDNGLQYTFATGAGNALLAYPGKPAVAQPAK